MAHKKAGGSSRNGRDSQSKRLGLKAFGGELVNAGSILVRQVGTKSNRRKARHARTTPSETATATELRCRSRSKSTVSIDPAKQ